MPAEAKAIAERAVAQMERNIREMLTWPEEGLAGACADGVPLTRQEIREHFAKWLIGCARLRKQWGVA